MSLFITQCPHCHTAFKTSISQLQSADGIVRCGACLQLFAADDNLLPTADLRTISRPAPDAFEDGELPDTEQLPFTDAREASEAAPEEEAETVLTLDLADSVSQRKDPELSTSATFWELVDESIEPPVSAITPDAGDDGESSAYDGINAASLEPEPEPEPESESESEPEPTSKTETACEELPPFTSEEAPASVARPEFFDERSDAAPTWDNSETQNDEAQRDNLIVDAPTFALEEVFTAEVAINSDAEAFEQEEPTTPDHLGFESGFSALDDFQETAASFATEDHEHKQNSAHVEVTEGDDVLRARVKTLRFESEAVSGSNDASLFGDLDEKVLQEVHRTHAPIELDWQGTPDKADSVSFYGLLAGTLLLILIMQIAWANRDSLSQQPWLRPYLDQMCVDLPCHIPPLVDLRSLHSESLQVVSHPEIANALRVQFLLRNDARFAQPFPILELRFTDTNDAPVAGRRFSSSEYLPPGLDQLITMPPGTPIQISVDIQDPGVFAVNYEIRFHSIVP